MYCGLFSARDPYVYEPQPSEAPNECRIPPHCDFTDNIHKLEVPFVESWYSCCQLASYAMLVNYNYQQYNAYDKFYTSLTDIVEKYCLFLKDNYSSQFITLSCEPVSIDQFCSWEIEHGGAGDWEYFVKFLNSIADYMPSITEFRNWGYDVEFEFPSFKAFNTQNHNGDYWSASPLMPIIMSSLKPWYMSVDQILQKPGYETNLRPFPPLLVVKARYSTIKNGEHSTNECNGDYYSTGSTHDVWMEENQKIQQLADITQYDHAIIVNGIQASNYESCNPDYLLGDNGPLDEQLSGYNLAIISDPSASANIVGGSPYNLYVDKLALDDLYYYVHYIIAPIKNIEYYDGEQGAFYEFDFN